MAVIGVNLRAIEGSINKVDKIPSNITVNSAPVIKSIEEKNVNFAGIKTALLIEFEFNTTYEPNIGHIKLSGEVLCQTENVKEIVKGWKKNKKISNEIAAPVLNAIFRRCLTKILNISEDLQLPPPIMFPMVRPSEEKESEKK